MSTIEAIQVTDIIDELNDVLARSYDAILGYKNASEDVKSMSLKAFFNDQIAERNKFAREIASEIKALGGEPLDSGTFKGRLHRAYMDVKSAALRNSDDAVIEECIRGEEAAASDYDKLLTMELPTNGNLRTLITEHKMQINQALNRLKVLDTVN